MITLDEAFKKFKSRLELNDREQANASARHKEVREFIGANFSVASDFLTGSYKRHTKTKPLKDIDIFFVLDEATRSSFRDKHPSVVLDAVKSKLVGEYGDKAIRPQGRSIGLDFGIVNGFAADEEDNTDYRILSVDIVPAYASGSDFEIPDKDLGKWIKTNPKTHEQKAIDAQKAYDGEWKGLVRMLKYWNNNPKHGEKPVKPSFLLEVMALECLHGGWGGRFEYEFEALFATLADRIHDTWPDPAGLGPPVSDGMDTARKDRAKTLLGAAGREARAAINLSKQGRNGDALKAWRALFGPKFPLS